MTITEDLKTTGPAELPSTTDLNVVRSSQNLGWEGLTVEEINQAPGELILPPQPQHMVCLALGQEPGWLEQRREGQLHRDWVVYGQAQLVPAQRSSLWLASKPAYHMHLMVQPEFLTRLAAETSPGDPARLELVDQWSVFDPQIERLSLALLTELQNGGATGRLYGEALSTALATYLLRHYTVQLEKPARPETSLPPARLRQVVEYIEANLDRDITLVELAQVAGLSQSHFATLFRQATGQAPHQFVTARRVERARQLLQTTRLPIAQIASATGFYDQSHLARHMRRLLKISPRQLRDLG